MHCFEAEQLEENPGPGVQVAEMTERALGLSRRIAGVRLQGSATRLQRAGIPRQLDEIPHQRAGISG